MLGDGYVRRDAALLYIRTHLAYHRSSLHTYRVRTRRGKMTVTNGNSVHPFQDKTVDLTKGDLAVELAVAGGPSDEEGE